MTTAQNAQKCGNELGNTEIQLNISKKANESKGKRYRRWCFTLNNYTEDMHTQIIHIFEKKGWEYVIGKEVGKEGTPHLQGYIKHKYPISFKTIQDSLFKRAHIEQARGNDQQNYDYCSKGGDFVHKLEIRARKVKVDVVELMKQRQVKRYENTVWRPWQQKILDIVKSEADDRTVYWIYDPEGCNGKSYLAKYLFVKHGAIIGDGKANDILNLMLTRVKEGKLAIDDTWIVILDIPRHKMDYLNYGLIEQLKNGFVYSGKYEGGELAFDPPHVIIFSNQEPEYDKFTKDRWHIIQISGDDISGKDEYVYIVND